MKYLAVPMQADNSVLTKDAALATFYVSRDFAMTINNIVKLPVTLDGHFTGHLRGIKALAQQCVAESPHDHRSVEWACDEILALIGERNYAVRIVEVPE